MMIRPTCGHWAVFKQIDMYHAHKLFEGTKEQCEVFVDAETETEKENAFETWLTDGKDGGALAMLAGYAK